MLKYGKTPMPAFLCLHSAPLPCFSRQNQKPTAKLYKWLLQGQVNSSEGRACHEEGEVTVETSQFSTDGTSTLSMKKLQLYTKALTAALVGRNRTAGLC